MQIDKRELRNVLGTFVTGVTIVTTLDAAGSPHGVTVNSFASVSLDPPLVLWSQKIGARSHPVYQAAERFVVNILAEDQVHLSQLFSSAHADRFSAVGYSAGIGRLPILEGCVAVLECRKVAIYPGGDHAVFLGEIESCRRAERLPLAFSHGRYSVARHIPAA